MPRVCNGVCYFDACPDCCDRGCCGRCWDVICCRVGDSANFAMNDPNKCCCGMCNNPCARCCTCDETRYKYCMCKCCGGNWICDPLALCCGEWKGNIELAEVKYNKEHKGAPTSVAMER